MPGQLNIAKIAADRRKADVGASVGAASTPRRR
jgi:hypothetical protein